MTMSPRTALCQEDVEVCPVCLGLVLKVAMPRHTEWHRTLTNLPSKERIAERFVEQHV